MAVGSIQDWFTARTSGWKPQQAYAAPGVDNVFDKDLTIPIATHVHNYVTMAPSNKTISWRTPANFDVYGGSLYFDLLMLTTSATNVASTAITPSGSHSGISTWTAHYAVANNALHLIVKITFVDDYKLSANQTITLGQFSGLPALSTSQVIVGHGMWVCKTSATRAAAADMSIQDYINIDRAKRLNGCLAFGSNAKYPFYSISSGTISLVPSTTALAIKHCGGPDIAAGQPILLVFMYPNSSTTSGFAQLPAASDFTFNSQLNCGISAYLGASVGGTNIIRYVVVAQPNSVFIPGQTKGLTINLPVNRGTVMADYDIIGYWVGMD